MEKPAIKDTHAVELDASALGGEWQTALDGLDKDVNAVAVELKDASGKIYYESKVPGAIDCGAVSGGSASRSAIAGLVDSDYYTIGRISTLHDSLYAYKHMTDCLLYTSMRSSSAARMRAMPSRSPQAVLRATSR